MVVRLSNLNLTVDWLQMNMPHCVVQGEVRSLIRWPEALSVN